MKKIILSFAKILCLSYVGMCLLVYFFPELFLFHPDKSFSNIEKARANGFPAKLIEYEADDGAKLYGWYTKGTKKNKAVIFTHGNSGNLDYFYLKLIPFFKRGYATFMPEYRGYGGLVGKMSDENFVKDVIAGLDELKKQGYENEDIIVYGMSLGSYMASALAHHMEKEGTPANALVLEVPFDNVPNTAKEIFPIYMPFDILFRTERFDNVSLLQEIDTRVLIQASEFDKIVPNSRAKELYESAKSPKSFMFYEGANHENLYSHRNYDDIMEWLKEDL